MVRKAKRFIELGKKYESNNCGWFIVIELLPNNRVTVRFVDTDTVVSNVRNGAALAGKVSDPTVKVENSFTTRKKYPIGSEYDSKEYGKVEILEVKDSNEITIKFKNSGHVQVTRSDNLKSGVLIDRSVLPLNDTIPVEIGGVFKTNSYGYIEILSVKGQKATVKFADTGNIKQNVAKSAIRTGSVKDNDLVNGIKSVDYLLIESTYEKTKREKEEYQNSLDYKLFKKEKSRNRYLSERSDRLKQGARYRKANPDKIRVSRMNRRARLLNAEGKHSVEDIQFLLESQSCKCVYCSTDISEDFHVDHILPLTLGGSNGVNNLQLLCPTCNLRKHNRHPDLWAKIAEQEFGYVPK